MRRIKPQSAPTVIVSQRRFTVWTIRETHFRGPPAQIPTEQSAQNATRDNEATAMLLEVETRGPRAFVVVQSTQQTLLHVRTLR
jgi:hypothetical protein